MSIRAHNHSQHRIAVALVAACCLSWSSADASLWTPAEISTIGWYDASDSDNVVVSGANVTNWKDRSGNGYDLNIVSNNPKYGSSTINSLNAIDLASTFSELSRTGLSIDVAELLVISVGMPQAAGDYPNLGSVYSTGNDDKLALRLQNNDTQGRISSSLRLDGTSTGMTSGNSTDIRDGVGVILAAYYDGSAGGSRVNGGVVDVVIDPADGATFTINEIQAGRDSNTPRNYHGEMIVVDAADLATIELTEGYLAWKWGLQGSLPGDHTYKLAAPTVIPEPSFISLITLGTLGLLFRRRRA